MKILLLSEDNSIFEENSPSRAKILEYTSLFNMFFVIIASSFEKDSNKVKHLTQNTWIYRTNSKYKFLKILNVFKLASFELNIKGIFQADLIICEGQFISVFTGYLLAKKYKRPLYIFLSEVNEKKLFAPIRIKNFFLLKIFRFALFKADCVKVDNSKTKEKLLKKSSSLKVEVIKPFMDTDTLFEKSKIMFDEEKVRKELIENKFSKIRFTAVTFVDNIEQTKIALEILKKFSNNSSPISLVLLYSDNLKNINRIIKSDFKPFVYAEALGDNLCKYLTSANVFLGISSGEKYEEVFSKACIVGAKIIAIEDDLSKKLIEDTITGFICPMSDKQEILNYFVSKIFLLMNNPGIGLNFKINMPISFKEKFSNTKEEYINKLKLSLEECLENYKKTHIKYYDF